MKKLIIFDLDGTLLDTSEGIIKCHQYAHEYMGKQPPSESQLRKVIGAPLLDSYLYDFKFSLNDAKTAVEAYRNRYNEKGVLEADIYKGIEDLLKTLSSEGYILMVATLKKEEFAKQMLKNFSISKYFTQIFGVDEKDKKKKIDLLNQCIEASSVDKKEVVLVGDSEYDLEGASACKIDFIGVSYGFGFKNNVDIKLCSSANEVYNKIKSY